MGSTRNHKWDFPSAGGQSVKVMEQLGVGLKAAHYFPKKKKKRKGKVWESLDVCKKFHIHKLNALLQQARWQ